MAAKSCDSRLAAKEESEITANPVYDPSNIEGIISLKELFSSCFGPNGSLKNIHNNSGGHVTVTSISSRILQNVSFSKPILRLITTSVQNHLKNYGDQGTFCGLLCASLTEDFLKTDFNQRQIVEGLDLFLDECMKYFNSDECECKTKLNFKSIDDMVKVVESVVSSKPLCGFTDQQLKFVSKLIVEVFLMCSANEDVKKGSIQYVLLEGYNSDETHIVDGILYEVPHIPVYRKSPLQCKTVQMRNDRRNTEVECIKVMLVDISLAGDSEDFVNATYELKEGVTISDTVLSHLLLLAGYVVDNSVSISCLAFPF